MSTIGIMGGSFNPVHIGHMMLAQYIAEFTGLDEVWLMLSPCNPLKAQTDMAPDNHRLAMLQTAVGHTPRLQVCDIELSLPVPSYTIDTFAELERRYPQHQFRLIIGADNWELFNRWRSHEVLLENYGIIVYPRRGSSLPVADRHISVAEAPIVDISSTWIRKAIREGRNTNFFLPAGVYDYIIRYQLYMT